MMYTISNNFSQILRDCLELVYPGRASRHRKFWADNSINIINTFKYANIVTLEMIQIFWHKSQA